MMGRRGGRGRGGGQVGDPLDGGRVVDDTGEGGKALDAREGGNLKKKEQNILLRFLRSVWCLQGVDCY